MRPAPEATRERQDVTSEAPRPEGAVKATGAVKAKGAVKAAAAELRTAVHELADRSVDAAPDVDALREASALVRAAAARLQGEPFPRWWEGPAVDDDERDGLRHYRHRSLFQGELHPFSPALDWTDGAGPEGTAGYRFRVTLSRLYEGPPAAVHGGYLAGLFDELLGAVQGLAAGGGGYTGRLIVRYRSLTPIEEELRFAGWIVSDTGRRIVTNATCHAGDRRCAEAVGLLVRPPEAPE